jgi:hypothetical protein
VGSLLAQLAGCKTTLGRGRSTERLTAVTLTHPFEIAQHELTWARWSDVVPLRPEKPEPEAEWE